MPGLLNTSTASAGPTPRMNSRRIATGVVFVAAAALIRFHRLEFQSLWNDEMFSLDVALSPLGSIMPKLAAEYHHPPLFFFLAHFILQAFGVSAAALRSVSAFFGSLTVGLVYLMTERLFGNRAAILASLLLLVAPLHLAYSQEGRPYALAAFLAVASCYTLLRVIRDGETLWMALYLLATVSLLYTHHWGLFVLAAEIGTVVYVSGIPRNEKALFVLLWVIIGLLYIPGALTLQRQVTGTDTSGWFWVQRPSAGDAIHLLTAYSGTDFNLASSVFSVPLAIQLLGSLALAIAFLSVIAMLATSRNDSMMAVLTVFSGTLLLPFIVSLFKPEVFLWYRYTIIPFPLLAVMIGGTAFDEMREWQREAARESWRTLARASAVIILLCCVWGTAHYFSWQKSNARDVAAYVSTVTRRGTANILIRPRSFAPLLNYYYKGDAVQYDEAYLNTPLGEIVDTASSFVYVTLDLPNDIRSYMESHFNKIAERHFPGEAHMGIVVGVYTQKEEPEE